MKLEKIILSDHNQFCTGEKWLFLGFCFVTNVFVLIRGVRKIAKKSVSFVMSVYSSARPSEWNNLAPTRPILLKLDIWVFFENL